MLEFDAGGPLSGSFVELDPPQHTRLRRLTAPAFRPKLIRDLAPAVEGALTEILDPLTGRDRFDLMAEVASPFPIAVISRLLGIPEADAVEFRRIGVLVGQSLDGVRNVRQARDLRQARRDLETLFLRLAAERRREPRDDVISLLATAEQDGRLAARDLVATCGLLLVAGFETTVNLIGNGLTALQRDRSQWDALVADPGRAEAVVEEALRFDPPVQVTVRMAREDLEFHGVRLARDTVLVLMLAAANRDPAAYAQPGPSRPSRRNETKPTDGQGRAERHVGRRRDRSEEAAVPRAHSRGSRRRRERRRADGSRLQRQHIAPSGQEQGVSAALVRQLGSRDLGRDRSCEAVPRPRADRRPRQHAQELLGVRHRHRLRHLGSEGMAHAPDDEDLRPERSGQSAIHPRLRSSRPAARIDSDADTYRAARTDLARPEGQSRLLRLRHQPRGRRADRRSGETARTDRKSRPTRTCSTRRLHDSICLRTRAPTRRSRCSG